LSATVRTRKLRSRSGKRRSARSRDRGQSSATGSKMLQLFGLVRRLSRFQSETKQPQLFWTATNSSDEKRERSGVSTSCRFVSAYFLTWPSGLCRGNRNAATHLETSASNSCDRGKRHYYQHSGRNQLPRHMHGELQPGNTSYPCRRPCFRFSIRRFRRGVQRTDLQACAFQQPVRLGDLQRLGAGDGVPFWQRNGHE
jgi:hypothetical protein